MAEMKFASDKAAVKYIFDALVEAGGQVEWTFDGEEYFEFPEGSTDWAEVTPDMFQTDDEHVKFVHKDNPDDRVTIYFVYGNEPFEVACDWSAPDLDTGLAAVLNKVTDRMGGIEE